MQTVTRWLGNAILLGIVVVVLTPMVLAAARHLLVPVAIVVALVCVVRVIWYWTSL